MKILFVADFGIHHNQGGAQRTNDLVIQEGLNRGHEIIYFHYDTSNKFLEENYDIVVSNNLEHLSKNNYQLFNYLLNHPRHVRYEHDSNAYLSTQAREALFGSTRLNIFLSEYHLSRFQDLYGDIFGKTEIVTSPVPTSTFYDLGEAREDKTVYIGFFHYLKGTNKFIRYAMSNMNEQFVVAGWGNQSFVNVFKTLPNVEFLGKVDHEEIPRIFNKYSRMYYHPTKFEPFCRSVGEALLCGMSLNCGDNIGAVRDYEKYGIDKLREMCENAPVKFWNLLEEL